MNELTVLLGAEIDTQAIYARLEELRSGLGSDFLNSVEECFGKLLDFPELGPLFRRSIRRLVMPKARYGIYYSVVGRRIFIHAVMNLRMDTESIFRKLWGDN